MNLLEAHSKALRNFSSIWTSEMQTQDLPTATSLTYHLKRINQSDSFLESLL